MELTIQDLGALGELLGSVAVLVTLIYLAMQTRQNTMAIEAQLDAAAVAATQNSQLLAATSDGLMEEVREDSTVVPCQLVVYCSFGDVAEWSWRCLVRVEDEGSRPFVTACSRPDWSVSYDGRDRIEARPR